MPLDKLNAALIAAIQNGTPEYTNPAAILTDKLNIGREAAYRRLRGEVPFTFGEAAVLSAQMNFSLDRAVGAVDFGNVLFRLSFNDYHTALEDYTGVIDQDTLFYREVSPDTDAEQAIAGNSFPRMLYMRYEGLTNFKLFKWLYQQGLVDCSTTKFEDMKVPDALLQSYRDLLKEAQLMPSTTLVFDGSCTKRWVNAICAFRNMHLITDQSVEMLKGELLQLLDELDKQAPFEQRLHVRCIDGSDTGAQLIVRWQRHDRMEAGLTCHYDAQDMPLDWPLFLRMLHEAMGGIRGRFFALDRFPLADATASVRPL